MEKFGNLVVNMVFRTRCKHCLYLYTFLSFAFTLAHTYTHCFAKLAMPQFEILGMVGLLAIVSTPDRHLGGRLCTWIVLQVWQSVPMNSWSKKKIKFVNISKVLKQAAVFINLRTCSELYKKQKVDIQKLHQIPVPTHPRSMNLKTRTRRYDKKIERCAFWNSSGQIAALG